MHSNRARQPAHTTLQHPHTTHFRVRASRCLQRLLTFLPGSCVRATGDWLKQRSHRLERMLQVNATAGLAACEQAAQSASALALTAHRDRGVGPSWACGALSQLLRVCFTPSVHLIGNADSYVS